MRTALLVIDMCNDFVADNGRLTVGKPAQEIVPFILKECEETVKSGGLVIFATDAHINGKDGNWPPHCDPETDGVEIYGELGEWCKENVDIAGRFPKTTYNAFWKTDLAEFLRFQRVETVKLVGVCTDICVFNSAAGAYFEGFKVQVLKKGCATLDFLRGNEAQAYNMMKGQFFAEIIEQVYI